MDIAVIVVYFGMMIAVGAFARRRVTDETDYLVAGRRLGPLLYAGTLSALVLGGASTVGGIGLGYDYGLSGMWLVVAIAIGLLVLSAFFAPMIQRIKVFTVAQALEARYGPEASLLSGLVMWLYAVALTSTSTIAYGTIFGAVFDMGKTSSILLGSAIVLAYSVLGGMWSITLTDFVQFCITTLGIFVLLLPFAVAEAGGFSGIRDGSLGDDAFDPLAIGGDQIITYLVVFGFGMLIGQDIWQRVFTARSPAVARFGGVASALYCVAYGVAGALIGAAASVVVPGLQVSDDAFVEVAYETLPAGLTGLVLAAALAAIMSTASGGIMASATVLRQDIVDRVLRGREREEEGSDVQGDRLYLVLMVVIVVVFSLVVDDVVQALTIAYDILVGGLLVPILLGLVWRRGTVWGALAAMVVGTVTVIVTMTQTDVYANEPVYYGLLASFVVHVVVSLATPRTPDQIMSAWNRRLHGEGPVTTDR